MANVKEYTLAEVVQHNGRNGNTLWIIYKDDVLDLTEFQYEHPGGVDLIQDEAGRDATKAFDSVGHSGNAKNMMSKYKIGVLVEAERRYNNSKPVLTADGSGGRSCLNIITCGLMG